MRHAMSLASILPAVRRACLATVVWLLCMQGAAAQAAWPKVGMPKDVQAFDVGGQVTTNGIPMRMQGFVANAKPEQLADWFRQNMGRPLVENTVGGKLILGRAQGEHYLTVQLEPAGSGTRGLVAVSHLKAAQDTQAQTQAATNRWMSRLPSGSQLMTQTVSEDAGKLSTYRVVVNSHSQETNSERIKSMMREDGLAFEREAAADAGAAGRRGPSPGGKTLFFKSSDKEAMAVIYRDPAGQTAVVLNTISKAEKK